MVKNDNLTFLLTNSGHKCNFILLLTSSGQVWQFIFLLTTSGHKWQFHIPTDILFWRMAISHSYWYLVVNNSNFTLLLTSNGHKCNFTLLLTSSGQEWQFHTAPDIYWWRITISHCYWYLVVNNGNFILLPTSSGHEWQFHIATESSGKEWQFHIATDI